MRWLQRKRREWVQRRIAKCLMAYNPASPEYVALKRAGLILEEVAHYGKG